jgi:hypothetical protein
MSADNRHSQDPYGVYTAGGPWAGTPQAPGMAAPQGGPAGTYPPGAYYPQAYPAPGMYPAAGPAPAAGSSPGERFVKGLLIGAAATYVLTNESVQRAVIRGAVQAWSSLQGGVEELKERFQDAEAELRAAEAAKGKGD